MLYAAGTSPSQRAFKARQTEVFKVRKAINATMVPVDATVSLDGPAIDQLTTLLMPKLTPFVHTVGSYWLTKVFLGSEYGITPLGDAYRVHEYYSDYLNSWVEPDPNHVLVIEQGQFDEYELHAGRPVSRPAFQKLVDAKPDLKAINDAITVIPFEEAQRFTKVGEDSTFLHFALAHGYHRILFDITRVLLDGGFQESLRDTIRSGDIVPLSVLSLPNHFGDYLQEDMTDLDIASFPTPKLLNVMVNTVPKQFAATVVATLAAQGKVDETLAYLKDLKEYVESNKANLPANDNAYEWVDSLRALPFIASAQCGQETAMRQFGPLMAKKYHSMRKYTDAFDWKRAKQVLGNLGLYAGPRPSTYVYSNVEPALHRNLILSDNTLPWYITDKDSDPWGVRMCFNNPMISCTEDSKLSFISYGKPRSEV
ncbi:hypothetical protein IWQ60_010537 [Tieghemiomyces parasiticus]|uniref:Uncharacterized protein n=1 Tax=Tieghemiomyces parasiticus TaxID=78921 RepID=A0A9W7ZQJ8_9FUNG|nr:hypothetical protein IWQ60_010537 [Tieghemiomyces parasiticus]